MSQFGSDPNIVNKSILLDNESNQVIGVCPRAAPLIARRADLAPLALSNPT